MKIGFPLEPSSTQITASLRRDHDLIKKVLRAAEACTQMLRAGKEVPPAILSDTVDFISNFIDRCHHAKEEKGLFASLVDAGLPKDVGPVAIMSREHEHARAIADEIKGSAQLFIANPSTENRASLVKHCEEYVELMKLHLLKEDTRLFVIAEMQLKGKEEAVGSLIQSLENETLDSDIEAYKKKAESLLAAVDPGAE